MKNPILFKNSFDPFSSFVFFLCYSFLLFLSVSSLCRGLYDFLVFNVLVACSKCIFLSTRVFETSKLPIVTLIVPSFFSHAPSLSNNSDFRQRLIILNLCSFLFFLKRWPYLECFQGKKSFIA